MDLEAIVGESGLALGYVLHECRCPVAAFERRVWPQGEYVSYSRHKPYSAARAKVWLRLIELGLSRPQAARMTDCPTHATVVGAVNRLLVLLDKNGAINARTGERRERKHGTGSVAARPPQPSRGLRTGVAQKATPHTPNRARNLLAVG